MIPAMMAAERGWAVFPCDPGEKTPAVPKHREADCDGTDPWCRDGHAGWEPRATTDASRITRAWAREPDCNYGVACGPSGLVVIDLDVKGDLPDDWQLPGIGDGRDVFFQICEWAGMDWPATCTVFTPSGGMHLYFRAPEDGNFRNKAGNTDIGPMIDIRAQGGYVVGPGSVTADGEYVLTDDQDAQPLPQWIARLLTPPDEPAERLARQRSAVPADASRRLAGLIRTVEAGRPGGRTNALVWSAFVLRDMICAGDATAADGDLLVQAAVSAGINGGERYARQQVRSVLGRPA